MNKIEEVVNQYNIKEKKEQIKENREKITHLKKLMSDLKIHRNVAIFADAVDKMGYGEEILYYLQMIKQLSNDPHVQEYSALYEQVETIPPLPSCPIATGLPSI